MVVLGEVSERGKKRKSEKSETNDDTEKSKCTAIPYRFNYMFCGDSRNIYKVILKVTRAIQLKDVDNINL